MRDWTRSAGTIHLGFLASWMVGDFWTLRFWGGVRAAPLLGDGANSTNAGEVPTHPIAGEKVRPELKTTLQTEKHQTVKDETEFADRRFIVRQPFQADSSSAESGWKA